MNRNARATPKLLSVTNSPSGLPVFEAIIDAVSPVGSVGIRGVVEMLGNDDLIVQQSPRRYYRVRTTPSPDWRRTVK